MSKQAFYNGILYTIEYKPELSNNDYTQHKVYHIKTDDENYPHAKKAIASIMEDELGYRQGAIWSEGWYQLMNKMCTSSLSTMRNLMYMYILLSDLMMIKLWQENILITEKTVIVS